MRCPDCGYIPAAWETLKVSRTGLECPLCGCVNRNCLWLVRYRELLVTDTWSDAVKKINEFMKVVSKRSSL